MSDYHINIFYSDEDGGYIADIPDLESCSAFGKTPEEALAEVNRAKEAWLQAAHKTGKPIPPRAIAPPFTSHRAESPYDSYINFMNCLDNVRARLRR